MIYFGELMVIGGGSAREALICGEKGREMGVD